MAEAQEEKQRQIRKIRELFHGRFTDWEVRILLDEKQWDSTAVVNYVFCSEPHELRQLLGEKGADAQDFESRVQEGLDLANEWSIVEPDGRHINKTTRQFSCPKCDRSWWKKVPRRKMVAKCFRCKKKYDALDREREWGWAEFRCDCGKVFGGFCQRITSSPCHACGSNVFPCRIIPPTYGQNSQRRNNTADRHLCNAPDCVYRAVNSWGRRRGRGRGQGGSITGVLPPGVNYSIQTCVHPRNLDRPNKRRAVVPSDEHVSSGSTIDTCVTQDDLLDMVSVIDNIGAYRESGRLPPIPEDRKDEARSHGDSSSCTS
ncbi:shiftless antiviral inhibitor of ribosomal frameshifting protein homolog [Liolophura sinensis]|uniref:shiftless antiviral inhibitor of ribosomal frameshifting protein homolog n=1 Tax=Liolophura sinensis TaxID=3198878 RepID=UPI0031593FD0